MHLRLYAFQHLICVLRDCWVSSMKTLSYKMINKCTYICSWLTRDKEEMEEIRLAKMLEEEKAQFAVSL